MAERARRLAGALGTVVLALAVSSCSGDDEPSPPPEATTPVWNPCDGLTEDGVGRALGIEVSMEAGEPTDPVCILAPAEEGGPALDANYLVFPAGLDEAWDTMGVLAGRTIDVQVPRADAARMVVKFTEDALLVTAFVQNGDLIQVVNLVDPAPFDRDADVRGLRRVLADLSAHADENGVA